MKNLVSNVNNSINSNNILKIFKGVITSVIINLILLLLLSIVLTYSNVSETVIPISIVIISGVSILIGSLLITKSMRRNGIMYGGIIGIIYIMLLYIISSIVSKGFGVNIYSILMIIFSVIAGMFGGILGVNINNI